MVDEIVEIHDWVILFLQVLLMMMMMKIQMNVYDESRVGWTG